MLFALYVNESSSLVSSSLLLFVDIKLHHCIHSSEDCVEFQHDIDTLLQWSKEWLLSFNVSKYKVLHIGNAPYARNYTLGHTHLELLNKICDLGVQMDCIRLIHAHTDLVVNKAHHVLGLICKSFECI